METWVLRRRLPEHVHAMRSPGQEGSEEVLGPAEESATQAIGLLTALPDILQPSAPEEITDAGVGES